MFEIGIFSLILFAIVYWAILFVMGRRDDVLHGEFVRAEPEPLAAGVPMPFPVAKQNVAPAPNAASVPPPQLPNLPPSNPEALQSLLVSLKRELKNAAKI